MRKHFLSIYNNYILKKKIVGKHKSITLIRKKNNRETKVNTQQNKHSQKFKFQNFIAHPKQ